MTQRWTTLMVALLLAASPARADESPSPLAGKVTAGGAMTSGNSDTQNTNATFSITHQGATWNHALSAESLHQTDQSDGAESKTSPQKFAANGSTKRGIGDTGYVVGTIHYEQDRQSGYRYRGVASIGYGMNLAPADGVTISLEAGPGWRRSDKEGVDQPKDEAIGRLAFAGEATLGAGTVSEKLTLVSGESDTTTQSTTTLSAPVAGLFSLEVSAKVNHTDSPPPDKKATDTTVTLGLAYSF